MRKVLAKEAEKRKKFKGVFSRIGKKMNYKGYLEETVLLKAIVDVTTGQQVADHLWFSYTKGFEKAALLAGDVIEFEARVKSYKKGYVNSRYGLNSRTHDFKLNNPTRIRKIKKEND